MYVVLDDIPIQNKLLSIQIIHKNGSIDLDMAKNYDYYWICFFNLVINTILPMWSDMSYKYYFHGMKPFVG